MPQAIKKLKQDEKKVVLAYASLKLKANRLSKELDTMKEHIVNLFERTNQNLIIVQDENGNSFGLQKINRVRKSFDKDKFKLAHLDLWNAHQKQLAYCEYKAIGDINGLQEPTTSEVSNAQ
jgi:ribosomal protein RSM22 (predicted rRNA methylase)